MALPLPQVVPDVGPGGGVVTSMRGQNALVNDIFNNQINAVKAKYAPLTTQADAASKLAYANLMGPQFLAKLLQNPDILANMKNPQDAINLVAAAGSGQGTGNAILNNLPNMQNQGNSNGGLMNFLVNKFKGLFNDGQGQAPTQNQNALYNAPGLSQQDRTAVANMQPGQSYVIQGQPQSNTGITAPAPSVIPDQTQNEAVAQNTGNYKGRVAEGQEAGKLRAQQINDLGDTVFSGQTKQATLDQLTNIISSPAFEQIRQVPILGHHELSYYQRYGTPEQQNMVGQLVTLSGNVIRDASQDFKGAFRKGEQELLSNMKINPGDTVDAAKGKLEQLNYLNKLITTRAQLTAQYMNDYHISKYQAENMAEKNINADSIRTSIHDALNPTVTIRNRKTGEVITVPVSEARKKYGVNPNV